MIISKLKNPTPLMFLILGAIGVGLLFFVFSRHNPDVSATAASIIPVKSSQPLESATPANLPSLGDIFQDRTFAPLKGPKIAAASIVNEEPAKEPPLATVAAAEAKAPPSPDPCEIAIRRLARTTAVPLKESIFDDVEAKYEKIRVDNNQRFLAIRGACVKGTHPKRG